MSATPSARERIRGCLLGGAVGDALGAPVEFSKLSQIRATFGADGCRELHPAYGRLGALTDHTQMTLFAAEGLLRARARQHHRGVSHVPSMIHAGLLRWLLTQGVASPLVEQDGWLIQQRALFSNRAPGNTCLSALRAARAFGEPAQNDSKGCGAVMRIAPIGLVLDDADVVYTLACESAQSTHGHVSSTLASGYFAFAIASLMNGSTLEDALEAGRRKLEHAPDRAEVCHAIDSALALARSTAKSQPETIERLGGGWVAEEALAIALFCALRAESFEHGLLLAINHSGDSDSTGSMTGQLLGAARGMTGLPERWLSELELCDVIERIAQDLADCRDGSIPDEVRYPA
ncbi:MAG TPA: ADP-ribosylglycohydrolase family protein [Polyangiales bacterium]|nr:ADP-ribosylglycohydrolase family protein [Polyangiales bacterium]